MIADAPAVACCALVVVLDVLVELFDELVPAAVSCRLVPAPLSSAPESIAGERITDQTGFSDAAPLACRLQFWLLRACSSRSCCCLRVDCTATEATDYADSLCLSLFLPDVPAYSGMPKPTLQFTEAA